MAKPTSILIKMISSADTGFFYVTRKNPRTIEPAPKPPFRAAFSWARLRPSSNRRTRR
jgi:hypothetical protein